MESRQEIYDAIAKLTDSVGTCLKNCDTSIAIVAGVNRRIKRVHVRGTSNGYKSNAIARRPIVACSALRLHNGDGENAGGVC